MREEFEDLPEIAEKLHTVVFSESHNTYHAKLINSPLSVMFVRGAWYAYQEQQKKIDNISKYLVDSCGFDKSQVKELLK